MRSFLIGLSMCASAAACSSSSEGEACAVAGTYSVESEQQSGDCPDLGGDTYTITNTGSQYEIEFAGAQGFCDAQANGACGLQAKCDGRANGGGVGTIQLALSFSGTGFGGSVTVTLPAGASGAECSGTYKLTGRRR